MKKQLILAALATLLGISLEAVDKNCFHPGDIITIHKVAEGIAIDHYVGNSISGMYNEEAIKKLNALASDNPIKIGLIEGGIDYSPKQLIFGGRCVLMIPKGNKFAGTTTALTLPVDFSLSINNLTTPKEFEKQASSWVAKIVDEQSQKPPIISGYIASLTKALQIVAKKWQEMIVIFKTNIQRCTNIK